jgi:excisionase family DNA binding protein
MIAMNEKTLSVNEAAKRLGVHPNTVRNGIDTGRIKAVKVLGRWRIQESEVERILRGGTLESENQEGK